MALLDLLGRRWVLRLMWELRGESLGFRELQLRCDHMSPSVLNQRLRDLTGAGVVHTVEGRYRLTPDGRELLEMLGPLHDWAKRWARRAPSTP
jgi:DNA-binding HxlR family transcriptional regulator